MRKRLKHWKHSPGAVFRAADGNVYYSYGMTRRMVYKAMKAMNRFKCNFVFRYCGIWGRPNPGAYGLFIRGREYITIRSIMDVPVKKAEGYEVLFCDSNT